MVEGNPIEEQIMPNDLPFFTKQKKVVLSNSGLIDPEKLEDYVAHGGYSALAYALREMSPEEVCRAIIDSGLRGRGGAGFPAGIKWDMVRKEESDRKFVVANGDEGDPGAYMDRTLMESDPHRVLEGMAIAGYAVGAEQGYVYVRGEYPIAAKRLERAIRAAERRGLLGSRILDSNVNFRIDVRIGAGAFVCGEETALMASIMGRRGQPEPRPPYPAQKGLWGKPTLLNNVETFGNIAPIIEHGPEQFAAVGTERRQGHQDLRPGRRRRQYRPDRSAVGHHPARDRLRHRRRHSRRPRVQGSPDRRPQRRLYPRPIPGHARRLREPA